MLQTLVENIKYEMNQQARLPRELVIIKCGVAVFALRVVWKICCTLGGLTTLGKRQLIIRLQL